MSQGRLSLCVLLPFAAGYYISYLFRSINALIAADLTSALGLSAGDLGLLTSAYFLVFAVVQLPCDGHYPAQAHQAAMAVGLGLQLIALGVFLAPRRQSKQMPMAVAVARVLGFDPPIAAAAMPLHYAQALSTWRRHVADTRRQVAAWRFAAAASMTLCAGLAGALSLTLIRPAWAFHVVEGDTPFRISSGDTSNLMEATMALSPWAPDLLALKSAAQAPRVKVQPDEP